MFVTGDAERMHSGIYAGTSPLYVFPNVFASEPSEADVLGAMSLIFWILSIVVLLKYVTIVLHSNDNGEGEGWLSCLETLDTLPKQRQ